MFRFRLSGTLLLGGLVLGAGLSAGQQAKAQAPKTAHGVAGLRPVPQADRVLATAPGGQMQMAGHLAPWANPQTLTTQPVDALTTLHLTVVLQRDPTVQKAFEALLAAQQEPGSELYHQWLTPAQVGSLYGPTEHDVNAVTSWLAAQGLTVNSVAPSRMMIQVSGPVNAVSNALHTSFSYYKVGGTPRLAVDAEPYIPVALAPVVRSIDGLSDLPPEPASHGQLHVPVGSASSHGGITPDGITPDVNLNGKHFLTPNDFAVIYDINPVYATGNTGAAIAGKAQHIAVIDRSDVTPADITSWAANVGVANPQYNTIFATGTDPGQTANGDQLESTLDLIRTIGTAPGAVSDLIVAPNSTGGILAAAQYNVNTLMDPVMTISFYGCEATRTAANVASWDTVFSTGAAEGISTFVCSGDSGAAGCASDFSNPPTTTPVLSVNYICSSSYATCVGGTEFAADIASPSTYWSATNGTGGLSALSYIPEGAWNEPTSTSTSTGYEIASSGGGASVYITKPSWQTGTGVPADGQRDQPDLAFSSSGHDGYYGCLSYYGYPCSAGFTGYYYYLDGTSAAAPSMAGITALLNTRSGTTQGNMNPMLYKLAARVPAAFHDVTVASSAVSSCSTTVASICNNSTPSTSGLTGGLAGYAVTAGYDEVTGLGSLDVTNFLAAASPVKTTLALSPATSTVGANQTAIVTATLTPATSSVAAPTGMVQFSVNGMAQGSPVAVTNNTASFSFQSATLATYSITAVYSGDSYFVTSSAAAVSVVVAPPTFTETTGSTAISFTSGAPTGNTNTVLLSSSYGFAGAVAVGCTITTSTAAFQPTCAVSPTSVTLASGGTGTATVSISSTVAQAALDKPALRGSRDISLAALGCGAVLGLGLLFGSGRRRRSLHRLAVLFAAGFVLLSASGCSGGSGSSSGGGTTTLRSSAGSYTVTVTAAGTSGSTTTSLHSTFTVTIN